MIDFRGRRREGVKYRERERSIVGYLSYTPHLGIKPAS